MHWSIVVADDHGPEWAPMIFAGATPAPIQYCPLSGSRTLLQKALGRALSVAPAANVMVTAMRGFRSHWEPSLWFVRAENRFVGDGRPSSPLATAAALLSIARRAPSDVVTLLPARCFVAHEEVLQDGLERAVAMLPRLSQGVVTLGMVDMDEGVDESYLVVGRSGGGPGLATHGYARHPLPWVARYLRQQGALVASGIMTGYAGVFGAHLSRHWPDLAQQLADVVSSREERGGETVIPANLCAKTPKTTLRALQWRPPSLSQRTLPVRGCGWSGLNSARAVARGLP
jgi:mannose-1-phosphate guanylyltransferase